MTMDETKPEPEEFPAGAEGQGSADTSTPFTPSEDDDSPVGDTDQHSKADHNEDPAEDIKQTGPSTD
jgi:hypothetical protein